uniref:Ig-like domain-containing protein n=1 Tax=uncultured Methanobrevibacter sp. TaxID=253161 RepID=UPI0025DA79A4
ATGKVNITLKGKKSNLTFSDLDLNNTIALGIIPIDEYNVTVIYSGDDLFLNGTANGTLIINMAKTQITADAIITTYNIDKDLVITLKDSNGNPVTNATVTVDLDGAKTYTTDTNGQVKVSTAGLIPKIYTAKITFAGDNNYNESSLDVGVTVNKATPILKAKKKTYKAKTKTKKFTIVLKDNTGKPIKNAKVRLMVKKITKNNKKGGSDKESKADKKKNFAVTNNKGKATFKVLRNKKGKYNAKVKFYSNEYYNKVTKTVKILIK